MFMKFSTRDSTKKPSSKKANPQHPDQLPPEQPPTLTPSQPRVVRREIEEKLDIIFSNLSEFGWSLGDLFHYALRTVDNNQKRVVYTRRHLAVVSQFLQGKTTIKPVNIVELMYRSPYSQPKSATSPEHAKEYARPNLSSWAVEITTQNMVAEMKQLVHDPELRVRATRKGAVKEMLQTQFPDSPALQTAPTSANSDPAVPTPPTQLDNLAEDLGAMGDRIVREMFAGVDSDLVIGVEPPDIEDDEPEEEESEVIDEGIGEEPEIEEEREGEGVDALPVPPESPTKKQHGRGKAADTLVSWDVIEGFTVRSVREKYQREAPTTWQVLDQLVDGGKKESKQGGSYRPKDVVLTGVMSEILYTRNQYCNLFPLCRSIAMFAMKSHQSAFRTGSRMAQCTPYTTTRNALETMASEKRQELRENPNGDERSIVLDNVQQFAHRRDHRIGTTNEMITGTGATAVVLEDCPEDAFEAQPYLDNLAKGERENLDVDKLLQSVDQPHMDLVTELHFLDILIQYVPALECYRKSMHELMRKTLQKNPINPTRKTTVHPLGTNDANEVSTKGMKEALTDFINQLGISEDLKTKLHFVSGDGKSFQGIGEVKKILADQPEADKSLVTLLEVLELWHTKWTELCRIIGNSSGDADAVRDPSSVRFIAQLINTPMPANLSKVEFYPNAKLLDVAVRAHVLRFWEVHLETEDIVKYFKDLRQTQPLPTLGHLRKIARTLAQQYASSSAYARALHDGAGFPAFPTQNARVGEKPPTRSSDPGIAKETSMVDPDESASRPAFESGPASEPCGPSGGNPPSFGSGNSMTQAAPENSTESQPPKEFEGDWALANSIILVRDGVWFLEYCRAVSIGDTGRVWEILKMWLFNFAGGGNTNYTNYLLEMFCKIEFEFPDSTKTALFNNWLVNLSGKLEGFIELDLMQEHFNLWLEELAQYKGKEFSDPWYRLVLSMHVHHFLRLKEEMEKMMDLVPRRKGHSEPHLDNEFSELLRVFRERDLHRFHRGRDFGHHSKDHFDAGITQLGKGKIERFIENSMLGRQGLEVVRKMDSDAPNPPALFHHPILYHENGDPYLLEQAINV